MTNTMIAQSEAALQPAESTASSNQWLRVQRLLQRSASTSLNGLDLQSWKSLPDRDDVVARERSS